MAMEQDTRFRLSNDLGEVMFSRAGGQYWLSDLEGFSSVTTAIYDRQYLGKPGASLTGYAIEARRATMEGVIFDSMATTRRHLLHVCAPGVLSRLEVIEPDLTTYLEIYFEKTPEISPGTGVQQFLAEVYAEYPYWRSERQGGSVDLLGIENLFEFPKNFSDPAPWQFGYTKKTGGSNVHLDGNMPSPFVLTITNTGNTAINHFRVESPRDGSFIETVGNTFSLTEGDYITIDTYNQRITGTTVYSNGTTLDWNGYPMLDPLSNMAMVMYPGDNVLSFQIDNVAGDDEVDATALLVVPGGVYSGV